MHGDYLIAGPGRAINPFVSHETEAGEERLDIRRAAAKGDAKAIGIIGAAGAQNVLLELS